MGNPLRALPRQVAALGHLGWRRAWWNLRERTRRRLRNLGRYHAKAASGLRFAGRARTPFLPEAGPALEASSGRFETLGRARSLGWPPDWEPPESTLWLFQLHYFGFLQRLPPAERARLVIDWIERYPPRRDRPGWMPYPLSLRLRSWTKLFFSEPDWTAAERERVLASIEAQGRCLAESVEVHLGGNHLLENAITLKWLSSCFQGVPVAGWAAQADALLEAELAEQFLPDGGHFERSPLYHALLLAALLDLVNVLDASDPLRPALEIRLTDVVAFLEALTHPDGEIALFNDSVFGLAPAPGELVGYAERLGIRPSPTRRHFAETGYAVWRHGDAAFVMDVGPIGPDYVPAHAHGDIFSFELSLHGRRVVVDGGTSTYEPGPERDWVRSTRAHSTVEVAGLDQCEFYKAFRVGRRGRPRDVRVTALAEGLRVAGWHDAYRRLRGQPEHHREACVVAPGALLVWDQVRSGRAVPVVSRLRFAPGAVVEPLAADLARVELDGLVIEVRTFGAHWEVERGFFAPRFGERVACPVLLLLPPVNAPFGYALGEQGLRVEIDAGGGAVSGHRLERGFGA